MQMIYRKGTKLRAKKLYITSINFCKLLRTENFLRVSIFANFQKYKNDIMISLASLNRQKSDIIFLRAHFLIRIFVTSRNTFSLHFTFHSEMQTKAYRNLKYYILIREVKIFVNKISILQNWQQFAKIIIISTYEIFTIKV